MMVVLQDKYEGGKEKRSEQVSSQLRTSLSSDYVISYHPPFFTPNDA